MGETRVKVWLVQPWFDEGDDWPAEPGSWSPVRAETLEAAWDVFDRTYGPFRGVAWYDAKEVSEDEAAEFLRKKRSGPWSGRLTEQEKEFLAAREKKQGGGAE